MLFNSFAFAVFLPIVFALYWRIPAGAVRGRNALLLAASYVFYGWWDWRFLSLLFFSSIVDYAIGRGLEKTEGPRQRRGLLGGSLAVNLGVLGIFKYYDFFASSLSRLTGWDLGLLHVILPVGISFYTFQTMSYTIDVYRRQIPATRDPLAFLAYVSFFPQLVAGPIERAAHLLPQFLGPHRFDEAAARDGLRQALWGLFKKVVVADNLAPHVDRIFTGYANLPGSELLLGAVFFGLQIYCDFSGYSDIAIGVARLFGFSLMQNFRNPYFAVDIQEFWRRWHISLTTWFRDYVYIPLGGSRCTPGRVYFNFLVVFLVSGFWHGANWTFLAWGLLHAAMYVGFIATHPARRGPGGEAVRPGGVRRVAGWALTFLLVNIAWIFFRAKSVGQAADYIRALAVNEWTVGALVSGLPLIAICAFTLGVEWWHRDRRHSLDVAHWPVAFRWGLYYALIAAVVFLGKTSYVPFIYFAF